jgi:hypothetical protein
MKQIGFFDENNCLRKLSKLGDQLEKLDTVMEWRIFESTLNRQTVTKLNFSGRKSIMKHMKETPEFRRKEVKKAYQPSKDKDFCLMEMSCYF